ncbi:hypothetical protein I3760_12G050400 [Carya illinoinensis]|nr:hypothetical protein I3760_12G050400 [Carya illinoinensis]
MSVEPFNRLVKLAARAFYDDITMKRDNKPKEGRSDNRGIAVVVLDALTRRQWAREEDLAKDLKLHLKLLRRTLRFFEEEKLVTRDHTRETAQGEKIFNAAVAATVAGQQTAKVGDKKIKMRTRSYCCLDYAQIYDVVRYRLQCMKKKMKDELENKNTVQEYICPKCGKRYTALDARLISLDDEYFHCESCNGQLVAESDELASQEGGEGYDNARRHMLQKMEVQLKPLVEQLCRVKNLPVPEFGGLQAWEARARAAGRAANGDFSAIDPSRSSLGLGYGPFLGDTKIEVDFSGAEGRRDNTKTENKSASPKVLPPWMIKEGMNLSKEQQGEVKQESNMDGGSASLEFSDDKKSTIVNDDKKNVQDEYIKAYYAALLKKQQELEEAAKQQDELSNAQSVNGISGMTSNRQVGMKSKREEHEGDDVEWEEAPVAGNANENYKVHQANVLGDDIDWEEG